MYVCSNRYIHLHAYVDTYIHTYIHTCAYTCMHTYIHIHTYIHTVTGIADLIFPVSKTVKFLKVGVTVPQLEGSKIAGIEIIEVELSGRKLHLHSHLHF